jgi:hypothetical protein
MKETLNVSLKGPPGRNAPAPLGLLTGAYGSITRSGDFRAR